MKRHIPFTAALAGLLTLAVWSAAGANDYLLRARIPFAFNANSVELPAGSYQVERLDGSAGVILIRSGRQGALLSTPGAISEDSGLGARIVFHRYGDRYFIREVWVGRRGYPVMESNEERELARAQEGKAASVRVLVPGERH